MIDPPEDDDADQLAERYRGASAADLSRPGDAVRIAIAAEARAQASARTAAGGRTRIDGARAAANDSHWPIRAAAGLAVVAAGALIAVQISRHPDPEVLTAHVAAKPAVVIPATAPAATPPAVTQTAVAKSPAVSLPAPGLPEVQAGARNGELARVERADSAAEPTTAQTAVAESPAAFSPGPASGRAEVQAVASSGQPASAKAADSAVEPAAPAMLTRRAISGALALAGEAPAAVVVPRVRDPAADRAFVHRYFPEAFRGPADGQPIWVLLDRHGRVLQSGRYRAADATALRAYLEGRIPGVRIDELQATTVSDGAGRSVDMTFAWVAADPGVSGGP